MQRDATDAGNVRQVTITGDLGSGKSIATKAITEHFGIERHSSGDFLRRAAQQRGVSVRELNDDPLATQWLDATIDGQLEALGKSKKSVIVDARLGWHFMPNSFKIKIMTKPRIAAQRIFADTTRATEKYKDIDDAEGQILARQREEWRRFQEKYEANFFDDNNFDLIVDSSFASSEQVTDVILDALDRHFRGEPVYKHWMSPLQLIPTENVRGIGEDICSRWAADMRENGYADDFPIEVCKLNRNFLIADGHKRVFGAASTDVELVPVALMEKGAELSVGLNAHEGLNAGATRSNIYDWQEAICCCRERMGFDSEIDFSLYYPLPTSGFKGYSAPSPMDA